MTVRRSRLNLDAVALLRVWRWSGGGDKKMTPSIQQENSKLEKAGKVNTLPSPSVTWKPHSASSGSWSVSAPFPSRAESFSPGRVSCLALGTEDLGLRSTPGHR